MVEKFFTQQIYSGQNKLIKDANCFNIHSTDMAITHPRKQNFLYQKEKVPRMV